jgi:heptosyltransferase I
MGGIGDAVHGLPIVNALKRDDPDRHITWVTPPEPVPLLQSHTAVDQLVAFDRKRRVRGVAELWRQLRPHRFDLVLNFGRYLKTALPTFFSRAPHKICYARDWSRDLVWLLANHHMPRPQETDHRQDQLLQFIEYIGVSPEPIEWQITLSENERSKRDESLGRFSGRPLVGVVVSSGRTHKDWPTDRFACVASVLEKDFGCQLMLLGGPGSHELKRAREVAEKTGAQVEWALGPDLRQLIYLIDGCDLVIAPDTGPLHIARALDTPVIGIYANTDPTTEGPYRAFEDLWVDRYNYDGPNQPTEEKFIGAQEGRMTLISVSDVLEKVERAMASYARKFSTNKPISTSSAQ